MLFSKCEVWSAGEFALRPEFLESCAPDSLFVFSVVAARPVAVGACIDATGMLVTEAADRCPVTVIVAGVHKDFPGWDLPQVSDEAMARSRRFFNQEWRE